MGAEQTLTSRNSQENVTSNNALSINDFSSHGLSLQRKASVANNTGVMQRMAWVATKPLDHVSKGRDKLPGVVNDGLDVVYKGVRTGVSAAKAVNNAGRKIMPDFLNDGIDAVRGFVGTGINAVGEFVGDRIDDARGLAREYLPDAISGPIDTVGKFASSGVDIARGVAIDMVNGEAEPFRYIDVCGKREPGQDVCYSSKVNYKIDHVDNIDDLNHRVLHSHIIFSDNPLSSKSQNSDFSEESEVAKNIRKRIEDIVPGGVPEGPSNIGFMGKKEEIHCDAKLFSEQVLHKTYTERKQISSSPEQDLKLMKSIEDHDPERNGSFREYDLNECNCQHWVKAVIDGAK